MSAHVLLNSLKRVEEKKQHVGLLSILFPFPNEFNKFKNTWAQMLDYIYHMA